MARNMIYKNGPFESQSVDMDTIPYGTVIRLRGVIDSQRITALVLTNGNVRILRNGFKTTADKKNLGIYACVSDLLSSVDQNMTVELTFPKCEPYICEDATEELPSQINNANSVIPDIYADLPPLVSQIDYHDFQYQNNVLTGRKSGTLIRATDCRNAIGATIYGVILQSGNVFLISYNNTNCINFSMQYEYTMPDFKETYGLTDNNIFTVY
jgi:hypothetical protein